MIIFEPEKYLKDIKKNGISANDKYAKFKMEYLMRDLISNSTYRKPKIIDITKYIAQDYFSGLPDSAISNELINIYESAKAKTDDNSYTENRDCKVITLYDSEMTEISKLKDKKLMKLAFAALVIHKHQSQYQTQDGKIKYYKYVNLCDADIYSVAEFDNVSGTSRKKYWLKLFDAGMIKYYFKTNPAWRFHPNWIATSRFTIPYNVDLKDDKSSEKVYKVITNYDDILSYLYFYLGDKTLTECAECGHPIKKGNARLCPVCAAKRKKESKKKYKNKTIA